MNRKLPAIVCDSQNLSQVAIIQALGKYNIPVIAISDSENAIGNASKYVSKKYIWDVPSYSENYILNMITYLERGVIFYSNDPNVENISEHKQKLISNGFKVIVADRCILNRVINKENLYATAQECSVNVPKTVVINSYNDLLSKSSDIKFPFILKANNFAGGIYCFVRDNYEIHDRYHYMQHKIDDKINLTSRQSSLLLQEWISQDNVDLWNLSACVLGGEILSYSMGRRVRTNLRNDGTIGSTLMHGISEYNEIIYKNNCQLFRHLKYEGIVETEWSQNRVTNETYLYDFNPRPSGNIRWALNSGLDINQFYNVALNNDDKNNKKTTISNGNYCNKTIITMKENVKYYKILYEVNDFVLSIKNPKLSLYNKLIILADNIISLFNLDNNVIDVLDIHDLYPTFRAIKKLPILIVKGLMHLLVRPLLKFLKRGHVGINSVS